MIWYWEPLINTPGGLGTRRARRERRPPGGRGSRRAASPTGSAGAAPSRILLLFASRGDRSVLDLGPLEDPRTTGTSMARRTRNLRELRAEAEAAEARGLNRPSE